MIIDSVFLFLFLFLLISREGEGGGGGGGRVVSGGGRRAPSLRLVNGRATGVGGLHTSSTESVRSPHHHLSQQNNHNNNHPRLNKDDSIKISIENTNTCTDSLVTALDDETLLITDFLGDTGQYIAYFTFSRVFLLVLIIIHEHLYVCTHTLNIDEYSVFNVSKKILDFVIMFFPIEWKKIELILFASHNIYSSHHNCVIKHLHIWKEKKNSFGSIILYCCDENSIRFDIISYDIDRSKIGIKFGRI